MYEPIAGLRRHSEGPLSLSFSRTKGIEHRQEYGIVMSPTGLALLNHLLKFQNNYLHSHSDMSLGGPVTRSLAFVCVHTTTW